MTKVHRLSRMMRKKFVRFNCIVYCNDWIKSTESKLRLIEEQYADINDQDRITNHAALEERMLHYQKQCDTRMQQELEQQVRC